MMRSSTRESGLPTEDSTTELSNALLRVPMEGPLKIQTTPTSDNSDKHDVVDLPITARELVGLPEMSLEDCSITDENELTEEKVVLWEVEARGSIVSAPKKAGNEDELALAAVHENSSDDESAKERAYLKLWEEIKSNPLYEILHEFADQLPREVPARLPKDRESVMKLSYSLGRSTL